MLPVPGQSSPRAFSGKPCVAGQTHHSYEEFAQQAAPNRLPLLEKDCIQVRAGGARQAGHRVWLLDRKPRPIRSAGTSAVNTTFAIESATVIVNTALAKIFHAKPKKVRIV
jgi:hypothetical protein